MTQSTFGLEDKYRNLDGPLFLSGTQALVRLLLLQRRRDRARGLNTGGFVSGYRGSPLGGLDRELWRAERFLAPEQIRFWPAINEDLAATAVWGTQMAGVHGDAEVDGVYSMWYGKGAGLDRCGDAMRHANASGVHPRGGVLAVVGDDHAQKSSTQPYFSEPTFADLLIPVLYPATIGEMIDFGLLGWELSRASGGWVGLKTSAELLDCSVTLDDRSAQLPVQKIESSAQSVHFRWPDPWHQAEVRWIEHRLPAIHAFSRANTIDRVTLHAPRPRLGVVTTGKSYRDLLQALHDLGVSVDQAADYGLTIYKVGMTWPIEPRGLLAFATNVDEILVIEEKRPIIEDQLRALLFDHGHRPRITGKKDGAGCWQFPWIGELSADVIARVLASKLPELAKRDGVRHRLITLAEHAERSKLQRPKLARPPYFCSGCPHNTSTKVPQGSRAIAGVGCHYMAVDMDRDTATFSQMGGEGATWIGQAPFTKTRHIFVNLGEGTYFHSGSLAVRACIAAGVNVTYKLLYNDAVAMTGGQPVDGKLTVPQLAWQLHAEGVREIRIVAEEVARLSAEDFPPRTTLHPRSSLEAVQRELRNVPGVTVLIFDQTCAAEKRRRRKRGLMFDPPKRAFINEQVCEGCGDCSVASNCLSIVPVDTVLGRKRAVDQSSCNKDLSCIEGFCPSFVTVHGGRPRRKSVLAWSEWDVPQPAILVQDGVHDIFIAGVGGTGVVTVGAVLGVAAHLEGKVCSVLDQLGMAQKGGAVVTHLRIGTSQEDIPAARVPTAGAHLLLGFDLPVTLQDQAFGKIAAGRTTVIVNTHETATGAFTRNPDLVQPTSEMLAAIETQAGANFVESLDATALATALCGDSIATNLFLAGYAFQKGLIPLTTDSIHQALKLNGAAVDSSIAAFEWGRRAAIDRTRVQTLAFGESRTSAAPQSFEELVNHRVALLTAYQNERYADQYRDFVTRVRTAEQRCTQSTEFSQAVARSLFKLMAYKDEYEVARLYTEGTFQRALQTSFEGSVRLEFHFAAPVLSAKDPHTGNPRKRSFGPWMFPALRLLARMKHLRGTRLDPFGYSEERRSERKLIADYRQVLSGLIERLDQRNYATAVKIARLPLEIRGFGHVKRDNMQKAASTQSLLLTQFYEQSRGAGATDQRVPVHAAAEE